MSLLSTCVIIPEILAYPPTTRPVLIQTRNYFPVADNSFTSYRHYVTKHLEMGGSRDYHSRFPINNTDQLMMSAILNRNIDKYEEILQSALRLKIESPTYDILAWSIYATSYDGNLNFLESTMSYIKSSNIPLNNLSGEFMDTLFEDTVNNTQYCCLDYLYGMVKLGILKRPSTKVEEQFKKNWTRA